MQMHVVMNRVGSRADSEQPPESMEMKEVYRTPSGTTRTSIGKSSKRVKIQQVFTDCRGGRHSCEGTVDPVTLLESLESVHGTNHIATINVCHFRGEDSAGVVTLPDGGKMLIFPPEVNALLHALTI